MFVFVVKRKLAIYICCRLFLAECFKLAVFPSMMHNFFIRGAFIYDRRCFT